MQTRFATPDDHQALAPLYAMVQDAHANAHPHRFKTTGLDRAALEALLAQGMQFLLAEQHGRAVGCMLIEVLAQADDFEHVARKALLIHNMALTAGDAAQVMFDAAYAYARSLGIHEIELNVWAFNAPVERWVKSMGYKPLHTRFIMDLK